MAEWAQFKAPTALAGFPGGTASQYVIAGGGYLATSGSHVYHRPDGTGNWTQIADAHSFSDSSVIRSPIVAPRAALSPRSARDYRDGGR